MGVTLTWSHIALRLACGLFAGALLGFDREEQGRVAGLRTMILVSLAATGAMIEANLLMASHGSAPAFLRTDPLRLPLGILSGIGFIGAGAIVRRADLVWGVTTAATLWIATVTGLIFGAGFYGLGGAVAVLSTAVVWGLRYVEARLRHLQRANLRLTTTADGPTIEELKGVLAGAGLVASTWDEAYSDGKHHIACRLQWFGGKMAKEPRTIVQRLAQRNGIVRIAFTHHR